MKGKLKYIFCNTNEGEVKITAIDEHGKVLEGTIATAPLANWLATNGNLVPVATDDSERVARQVG